MRKPLALIGVILAFSLACAGGPPGAIIRNLYDGYELEYVFDAPPRVEQLDDPEEVLVHFSQIIRNHSLTPFQDNRVEGFHVMRLSEGRWRLVSTTTTGTEFL